MGQGTNINLTTLLYTYYLPQSGWDSIPSTYYASWTM
jgi:hypothetical protein